MELRPSAGMERCSGGGAASLGGCRAPRSPQHLPPPSSQFFGDLWVLSILLSLGTTTTGAPSPPCPPPVTLCFGAQSVTFLRSIPTIWGRIHPALCSVQPPGLCQPQPPSGFTPPQANLLLLTP